MRREQPQIKLISLKPAESDDASIFDFAIDTAMGPANLLRLLAEVVAQHFAEDRNFADAIRF